MTSTLQAALSAMPMCRRCGSAQRLHLLGIWRLARLRSKGNEVRMPGAGNVERLTLRNAPARDVLMTLGRAGGYNVAFYSKKGEEGSAASGGILFRLILRMSPLNRQ